MRNVTSIILMLLVVFACSKTEDMTAPTSFDEAIAIGGDLQPAIQSEEATNDTTQSEVISGEVWNCTTTTYDIMAPGGGNKGFPLFNPNASVIYPGSLL